MKTTEHQALSVTICLKPCQSSTLTQGIKIESDQIQRTDSGNAKRMKHGVDQNVNYKC